MADERRYTETSEEWELFLLNLRYRQGKFLTLGGNEPFLLDGADRAWLVYNGTVDVFAVQVEDGRAAGARHHMFRAHTHQLLLGSDLQNQQVGLLANCAPETQILQMRRSQLEELARTKEETAPLVNALIEDWIRLLSSGITTAIRPKEFQILEPGQELAVDEGQIARGRGGVLWVQHLEGRSGFMGRGEAFTVGGDVLVPTSENAWLQALEASRLQVFDTATVLAQNPAWTPLDDFYGLALSSMAHDITRERAAVSQLIRDKVADDQARVHTAFTELASAWNDESTIDVISTESADPLLAACRLVAQPLGVTIHQPPDFGSGEVANHTLSEIARASQIRMRLVLLRGDWWRRDNGPLLAYRGEDRYPVALLPQAARRYELHDPVTRERIPVDDAIAAELGTTAYMLYRPFPNRRLNWFDLVRFGTSDSRMDLLNLLLVGLATGILGLAVPVVTGIIFDDLIPAGDQPQLVLLGLILAVTAVATALFQVVRGVALLRIEGDVDSSIQAAVWDRLLNLPADFFRKYSAGDLTERAMGITRIKQILSGSVAVVILSGLFSWFNILLLFYYDSQLALMAVGVVLLSILVMFVLGQRLLRYQRLVTRQQGQISGLIAQLVSGIAKLRVAGAEGRVFFLWARAFSEQKKTAFRARSAENYLVSFVAVYPILAAMVVYAMAYDRTGLSTGQFLAFNAAFAMLLSAGLQLAGAANAVIEAIPLYERLKCILEAVPEVDEQRANPGELSGRIEVSHLTFRYDEEGPLVLDDVTFSVASGEFVALVGASGSGKSTLLRHLLGFEQPTSGGVYYDGQALSEIDLRAVRRQIGVVLQHSQVMTGTILQNILGSSTLTVDDAWEAARQAGIDEDIKAMPMGMQTYISEGGSTFSGGQRQRLLIARALVTRPRIIFFDEATSALDDRAQALVTDSLKRIDATRIVIAHRLSTIVDADRIIVLERGRIVERGTYQDLLDHGGQFTELAHRQLI